MKHERDGPVASKTPDDAIEMEDHRGEDGTERWVHVSQATGRLISTILKAMGDVPTKE